MCLKRILTLKLEEHYNEYFFDAFQTWGLGGKFSLNGGIWKWDSFIFLTFTFLKSPSASLSSSGKVDSMSKDVSTSLEEYHYNQIFGGGASYHKISC